MQPEISYKPIGFIKTPFRHIADMPIQPSGAGGVEGIVELNREYEMGLVDLGGFSHLILLYHFHLINSHKLMVIPFMDDKPHGIFATRAPARPNAIGISVVKLKKIKNNLLSIEGVDMVNGTPLLDLKPFFPTSDNHFGVKYGWLEGKENID